MITDLPADPFESAPAPDAPAEEQLLFLQSAAATLYAALRDQPTTAALENAIRALSDYELELLIGISVLNHRVTRGDFEDWFVSDEAPVYQLEHMRIEPDTPGQVIANIACSVYGVLQESPSLTAMRQDVRDLPADYMRLVVALGSSRPEVTPPESDEMFGLLRRLLS